MHILIDDTYFSRWQGGHNYLKNIMIALKESGAILHRLKRENEQLETEYPFDFTHVEEYPKKLSFNRLYWKLNRNKTWRKLNPWINQIDLTFQVANTDIQSNVKSVRWIPDFQHVEMPELFSEQEIHKRDKEFEEFAKDYDIILLSSYHAQSIFNKLYPFAASKSRVYQFTVNIPDEVYEITESQIREKYHLPEKYIHFPSQWWKHKNHQFIFEVMTQVEETVHLVCTGKEDDYRNPEYAGILKEFIKMEKLESRIQLLGDIPYSEMLAIMRFSNIVINPSSYEGWSTTVEEAKLFVKKLIVLDTPIFKEQLLNYTHTEILPFNIESWIKSLSNQKDVLNAILSKTKNSKINLKYLFDLD